MRQIKLRVWIMWALLMFMLGVLADYYFLHILFHQKQLEALKVAANQEESASLPGAHSAEDDSFLSKNSQVKPSQESPVGPDTFLSSLQACAPEIAAQTVATPEALLQYLQKSVGAVKEEVSLENYHLTLPDGSLRRVHVITADNTNSTDNKEIRFFKLDAEGYPERIPLKGDESLESLLSMGRITRHELKADLYLKDKTSLSYEKHDAQIFELQFNNHGKILSCRHHDCQCQ